MSLLYRIVENACFILNRLPGPGPKDIMMSGFKKNDDSEKLPRYVYKRDMEIRTVEVKGHLLHKISLKGSRNKKAVFFLPGGGGLARATRLHYMSAIALARDSGNDIIIAEYPLAPKSNVIEALDWLMDAHAHLLSKYAANDITFMGDSAGANLILSLTGHLEDTKKPGRLIVISPACGLENGKPRDIRLQMEAKDPILSVAMNDIIAETWARDVDLKSPDISPEYIDYKDFPPMTIFYGEHELFYPHVEDWLSGLKAQGVELETFRKPMCHDWPLCYFFAEGREAVREMCRLIK